MLLYTSSLSSLTRAAD